MLTVLYQKGPRRPPRSGSIDNTNSRQKKVRRACKNWLPKWVGKLSTRGKRFHLLSGFGGTSLLTITLLARSTWHFVQENQTTRLFKRASFRAFIYLRPIIYISFKLSHFTTSKRIRFSDILKCILLIYGAKIQTF